MVETLTKYVEVSTKNPRGVFHRVIHKVFMMWLLSPPNFSRNSACRFENVSRKW